jgi:hypothetical protein
MEPRTSHTSSTTKLHPKISPSLSLLLSFVFRKGIVISCPRAFVNWEWIPSPHFFLRLWGLKLNDAFSGRPYWTTLLKMDPSLLLLFSTFSLSHLIIYFLVALGFEFMALSLLGRDSITWVMPLPYVLLLFPHTLFLLHNYYSLKMFYILFVTFSFETIRNLGPWSFSVWSPLYVSQHTIPVK